MNFHEKVIKNMRDTGNSYHAACREMGAHGGEMAARKKRIMKQKQQQQSEMMRRQKLD